MEYNELYHHGIQGMKWGVRRFQNKDGSLTSAGKKRYDTNDSKKNDKKKAVANYNKDYERSIKSQDKADAEWAKVKSMYNNLGKTPFERIKNASAGKSKAAKDYLKAFDKAEMLQDKADADWVKAKDSYIKTGKNSVSRLINNILFDSVRDTSGQTIRDHINKENDRFKRPTLEDDRKRNSNSNI